MKTAGTVARNGRIGLAQHELDGVVVHRRHRAGLEHSGEEVGRALVDLEKPIERVDHVLGRDRRAVREMAHPGEGGMSLPWRRPRHPSSTPVQASGFRCSRRRQARHRGSRPPYSPCSRRSWRDRSCRRSAPCSSSPALPPLRPLPASAPRPRRRRPPRRLIAIVPVWSSLFSIFPNARRTAMRHPRRNVVPQDAGGA